jgi:hypothetical protein
MKCGCLEMEGIFTSLVFKKMGIGKFAIAGRHGRSGVGDGGVTKPCLDLAAALGQDRRSRISR